MTEEKRGRVFQDYPQRLIADLGSSLLDETQQFAIRGATFGADAAPTQGVPYGSDTLCVVLDHLLHVDRKWHFVRTRQTGDAGRAKRLVELDPLWSA